MEVMKIMLDTLEKVKNFTEDAEKCDADMDLISGRSYVDARSILGVCSLVRVGFLNETASAVFFK